MLATLSGDLCLLFGLALLLLPLLATELSRPRDGVWGAIVLLLGLVLVTSSDRLRGAPMLAVLCGSLLISRLSSEVGQARWRALSEEEQQRLTSIEHWLTGLKQLASAAGSLGSGLSGIAKQIKPAGRSGVTGKRWIRPESEAEDESKPTPSPTPSPTPTPDPTPTPTPAPTAAQAADQDLTDDTNEAPAAED
ncbi:MAG: hypothetical protein CL862_12560 [Cyanobium sp. NAT70]|nr:hypothetical protein [Cyanobium sp. NAT70]MAR08850.1 hypothetical protein [Blastopirellula sp.]|tara:strand:- start:1098 stop:1676 length:579 start_codon:yes stop_codon:yes gene_type:complete